jgi:hypothetical protein
MRIDDLESGTIATQFGEYSIVVDDNNGKWYSLLDERTLSDKEIEGAISVSDMDEDHAGN